jgi:energy-converting hydrogenase Eha subunit C
MLLALRDAWWSIERNTDMPMHLLLAPMLWSAHAGRWIDSRVLSPFQLGTTAKDLVEEELGVFGVLGFLVFKVSRLLVESWRLSAPRWLAGRIARGVALASALIGSAWLLTCAYIGLLIPIVGLDVSYTGLLLAPVCAWIVLGYVLLAEHVRARRAELEAETGEGD